jgi:hypothetical protein
MIFLQRLPGKAAEKAREEAQAQGREDTSETGRRQQSFTAQVPMDKDGCVNLPVSETQRHKRRATGKGKRRLKRDGRKAAKFHSSNSDGQ